MTFADQILNHTRPRSIRTDVAFPRRQNYYPSPVDWKDEILYFLLVDRFSDGFEHERMLLERHNYDAARPNLPNGDTWRWDRWAESGTERWQGGTLQGVKSKLNYLKELGVTAIWLSPVFKQRGHLDSYHGYGIQDFLDVDPHFGTRGDLVELVAEAHRHGIRVILDTVFNHSGMNWLYAADTPGGIYKPFYTTGRHVFGSWQGADGQPVSDIAGDEDGVWPIEFQDPDCYTRAGKGNLDAGDIGSPDAEHKRSDFETFRDFNLEAGGVLTDLALCYKYWIALADLDGLRIDTVKHVSCADARKFCGAIREFALNLGKENFFIVAEVAGGNRNQGYYLDALEHSLSAVLDIGEARPALCNVAKGLAPAKAYFDGFDLERVRADGMATYRRLGNRHVSIVDDHDQLTGEKIRFSSEASSECQVVTAVAMQLLTLGIPCLYYGMEQALAGPEAEQRCWLPEWGRSDRYLREAMFGPMYPRKRGRTGLPNSPANVDQGLPGFGPFGTAGRHCFDPNYPVYQRIAALAALRQEIPALRHGRQYLRPTSPLNWAFAFCGPGEIVAWSRILDDEELVCILNTHGKDKRSARILVDANINSPGGFMTVMLNTECVLHQPSVEEKYQPGQHLPIQSTPDGRMAYIETQDISASEVVVLSNRPQKSEGMFLR